MPPVKDQIPVEIVDTDDGKYHCKYTVQHEGTVDIKIEFEDDKGKMVPLRGGAVYKAAFVNKAKVTDNTMHGGAMDKYIKRELDRVAHHMADSKKELVTKDKDLKDVKVLLNVKEQVERTQNDADKITHELDQLDESLKLFVEKKQAKDSQLKALAKLNKEWVDLKKIAKDTKKEIAPLVDQEMDKNNLLIKKLEEEITQFTQEMKKREFFQYKCGTVVALEKLNGVFDELAVFEEKIKDYGENAKKFGKPEIIHKAIKDVDGIKVIVENMKLLWDHIELC